MTYEVALERVRALARESDALGVRLPNGVPNLDAARVRLAEGLPALAGEPLIDWATLAANLIALGGDVDGLSAIAPAAVVEAALAGAWDTLGRGADDRTITLLDYAVRPALRAGFSAVRDLIGAADWKRGSCPACGALPTIAELRGGKEGESRVLRCGRCSAAWTFDRLTCPGCGEHDHAQLRYLHVDGEVGFRRAECCLTCGFYVKAVARLEPIRDAELFEVDVETLALDALALDAGYQRAVRAHHGIA